MKTYLEIAVSANEHQRELLIPTFVELGSHGFQETDSHLLCYFDKSSFGQTEYERLLTDIKALLQTISANAEIKFREFEEENWNRQWEQSIQPIEIGTKLAVKPSWSDYENSGGRIVLHIDPKMSFGTGYHETTRLVLRLLESYVSAGQSVLDIGTGTGILAVAAIKLGAKNALGIDIDDWSIENARENITANGVADKIKISNTSLEQIHGTFDLITANIQLNVIVEMLPIIRILLKDNAIVLLSGLLQENRTAIHSALESNRFEIVEETQENEWIALAVRKNGSPA
ncbi:MAG TPA: 50S ribosomal protein L11 methyltransferase [Bacteroidota bacterium]|nr:50S ribosomal protein L11 methyltransferase [Bacteroidota bacterium]